VQKLVVAVGIAAAPLSTPEEARGTAQVVVLVLAPPSEAGLYLQTVAALAAVLRDDAVVDRLVEARSPSAVLEVPQVRAITIQPRLTVRDVMTQRVYRVGPDSTVREVLDLISEQKLSAIPVVDEERVVLGMVSDRDLMRFLLPRMQKSAEIPASLRDVTVSKDLERLPVVSEGKLTGFLTRGDILRKLFG
jgi:CBS domain-containing protein